MTKNLTKNLTRIESSSERKPWRPWRATDFESLMYPNFCIRYMIGFFSYRRESSTYAFSGTRFAYSSLLIFVLVIFTAISIYQINYGVLKFSNLSGTLDANLYLALNGGIVVIMYILSRPTLRTLQSISQVSQILSPKDFNDLARYVHTKDFLGFIFVIMHLPNCFKTSVYHTMRHLAVLYITLASLTLDMFYMNCVCILKVCFGKVNEGLRQLNRPTTNDETLGTTPSLEKTFQDKRRCTLLIVKLKSLEEKHLRISDVVQVLNETFFLHTTTLIILTFLVITFNSYFFILWLNGGYTLDMSTQFWYIQFLPSVLHYTVKFIMIIWTCETAKNQALEIGTTIHDVLGDTNDALVQNELELFSLQVLHRDNTFSAKVVTMDASLLTQMVGGVVMYLLILFQFLMNSISCNHQD